MEPDEKNLVAFSENGALAGSVFFQDAVRTCVVHSGKPLSYLEDDSKSMLRASIGSGEYIIYDEASFKIWNEYSLPHYLEDKQLKLIDGMEKTKETYWDRYPADEYSLPGLIKTLQQQGTVRL